MFFSEGHFTVITDATHNLDRIASSPQGAQAVVDANMLDFVPDLLGSPNPEVRKWTCQMLEKLAHHKSTMMVVLKELVSLLRAENPSAVVGSAAEALSRIAISPGGAQAALDAHVLDSVGELLESSNQEVRDWMGDLLRELGRHETTAAAVVEQLVSLCRGGSSIVIEGTVKALGHIAQWPAIAPACVEGKLLEYVTDLLESPNAQARRWTCKMLGELSRHATTVAVLLAVMPCEKLVMSLRDANLEVVCSAAEALSWIIQWSEGAEAAVNANILEYLGELLGSSEPEAQRWACHILGILATYESTTAGSLGEQHCTKLVSLLHNEYSNISALEALCWIVASPTKAQLCVNAKVLDYAEELLASPDARIQNWACQMMRQLRRHMADGLVSVDLSCA
ncbi:armadillo-type protein [Mycena latifolia]|nr:armadillo-type protein [Mycena latifolia]